MSTQDRNIDRNAEVGRKYNVAIAAAPTAVNVDQIRYLFQMRHNFRVTDLGVYAQDVGTAIIRARACVAKELSAVGAPLATGAAAVTFAIEAFTQLDAGVFTAVGATAAQAFGNTAVVNDTFWGSWTVQIDGAQVITTKPAAQVMAFLTQEEALKQAPTPDAANGLVGVLTIEANGGNFIAGTTLTNAALVDSFDLIDRGGLFVDVPISATPDAVQAELLGGVVFAGNRRLHVAKLGNLIGETGDFLVATVRSTGAATMTDGKITLGYRKFPLQGESGPDVATGLSAAQVV